MSCKKFFIIAAICENNGIGHSNKLVWNLKNEMKFFTQTTSQTSDENKRNVVIVGSKTWNSIPPKFRPLSNRINVVISKSMKEKPEKAHYLFNSLEQALKLSSQLEEVEKIFVIGGAQVYQSALKLPECDKLYITKIHHHFDCDTFFPAFDENLFQEIKEDNVPQEMQTEKEINYSFHVYKRIET